MIVIRRKPGQGPGEVARQAPQGPPPDPPDPVLPADPGVFRSEHLESDVLILPGVFTPMEAESRVFPFMKDHSPKPRAEILRDDGTALVCTFCYHRSATVTMMLCNVE